MNRRLATIAAVLALGSLGAAACSDDDDGGAVGTDTTATTVAESTTTTAASATTGTTAVVGSTTSTTAGDGGDEGDGPAIPTDPQAYAEALIGAWESGDAATAHVLATDEAFDQLFAQEGGGAGTWQLDHCEGAAGSSYCTFRAGGDPTVIVRVLNEPASQASPQAVTEVRFEG